MLWGVPGGDPPGRPLLRAVCILLECILVGVLFFSEIYHFAIMFYFPEISMKSKNHSRLQISHSKTFNLKDGPDICRFSNIKKKHSHVGDNII